LSSVRQPRDKIGHAAADLLFTEMAAVRDGTPHTHQSVHFTPELEVRRSTVGATPARRTSRRRSPAKSRA